MPRFVPKRLSCLLFCALLSIPAQSPAEEVGLAEKAPLATAPVSQLASDDVPANKAVTGIVEEMVQADKKAAAAAGDAGLADKAEPPAETKAAPADPQPAARESEKPATAGPARHFTPSIALVRHLMRDTELAAMQLSLGLVNFVGDTEPGTHDPDAPEESAYAILPLSHDAVLEIYDLHYDGQELTMGNRPRIIREMGANEAYVLRVPFFGGVPTRGVCVSSNGRKYCWNPGENELNEGFLNWSKTKGLK